MEDDLLEFVLNMAPIMYDGTGVNFHSHDKHTNQLFLTVGPLFTEFHRSALMSYLRQKYPKLCVGIILKEERYGSN